jgi:alkylmercury lyase
VLDNITKGGSNVDPKQRIKQEWEEHGLAGDPLQEAIVKQVFPRVLNGEMIPVQHLSQSFSAEGDKLQVIIQQMIDKGAITIRDDHVTGIGGLSVEPTRHQLKTQDQTLYTWCAVDGVGIPGAFSLDAEVQSTFMDTGELLSIVFSKGEIIDIPPGAAYSLVPREQRLCGGT